jgi:serine protease Do
VPIGSSAAVREGQFCLATGHPGGYETSRPPVLRWGRILKTQTSAILTDCTLVGGDSGGPLFNLDGQVIGIHSRIGKNLTINVHVPIDPFRESWDRLAQGDVWGLLDEGEPSSAPADEPESPRRRSAAKPSTDPPPGSPRAAAPWLGVVDDPNADGVRLQRVVEDSPAAAAGLLAGDVILRVDQRAIESFAALQAEVRRRKPGEEMLIELQRGEQIYELPVRLGKMKRDAGRS